MHSRRFFGRMIGILLVTAGISVAVAAFVFRRMANEPTRLVEEAKLALASDDHVRALSLVRSALARDPNSSDGFWVAAQACLRGGDTAGALDYLLKIPSQIHADFVRAQVEGGRIAMELGRLSVAETCYRAALQAEPANTTARSKLLYILRIEGRNWESRSLIESANQGAPIPRDGLFVLYSHEWVWIDGKDLEYLEFCKLKGNDGYLPYLGPARQTLSRDPFAAGALEVLRRVSIDDPPVVEAIAWYGSLMASADRDAEFIEWQEKRSSLAEAHPQVWYGRGVFLNRRGRFEEAARCFLEATLRDANHRAANYQLGLLLVQLGQETAGRTYLERARRLAELDQLLHTGAKHGADPAPETVRQMIDHLVALGRAPEASSWLKLAESYWPDPQEFRKLEGQLRSVTTAAQAAGHDQAPQHKQLGVSLFPLPSSGSFRALSREVPTAQDMAGSFGLVDVAKEVGVDFRYYNGAPPENEQGRMFEFSGGGVGVVDFDLDDFPDLFLTQGEDWPPTEKPVRTDQLFRNRDGQRFQNVTSLALPPEHDFTHGIAVGDFNNDGFPDLFAGNMGRDRVYENMGDGTFRDVTDEAGVSGDGWTLSCAIADVNSDGVPDLYAINYLGGPDVFSRICKFEEKPVQCLAGMFAGEPDQLYQGAGNGEFDDISDESGVSNPAGKGMGVVAGDFARTGKLSLYVANDGEPNFLWQNDSGNESSSPKFSETGLLMGVATNSVGRAQASMGIAAGDVNQDGVIDFFVTNFFNETNNLFLSDSNDGYRDVALESGLLKVPTTAMGWGTQFSDFDLDGDLDLLVANGHLGLRSARGAANRMNPHLWRNDSSPSKVQFSFARGGKYFEGQYLGRSVATLDWNRDGRPDACITHVDHPVSLLMNATKTDGNYLAITLIGTESARDAVGASVTMRYDGKSVTRFVTAGDGFASSNEKRLTFGLGRSSQVDELIVRWPSGLEQQFTDLGANRVYVLIEGRRAAVMLNE